jgi:hypothetical protein
MQSFAITFASLAAAQTCTPVTWDWTDTVGVAGSPGELIKTRTNADWDSGAASTQALSYSTLPQSVSFKCNKGTSTFIQAGLGYRSGRVISGISSQDYGDVGRTSFALYCHPDDPLTVKEGNPYDPTSASHNRGQFSTWTADDVMKIQVTGHTVEYLKNDVLFYTSATPATFPLYVDVSMGPNTVPADPNTLSDVTICSDPNAVTCAPVTWRNADCATCGIWGAVANPGYLEKVAGSQGVYDVRAISTRALQPTSAHTQSVSFQCSHDSNMMAGLGRLGAAQEDLAYGVWCRQDNKGVHIREHNASPADEPHGITYTANDVFMVRVTGTTVQYLKNRVVFYTSTTPAGTFPLYADAGIASGYHATFRDVTICYGALPTPAPTAAPTDAPTAPAPTAAPTDAPTAPACTDTPASTAAVGSTLRMYSDAGPAVAMDLLEDGTVPTHRVTRLPCTRLPLVLSVPNHARRPLVSPAVVPRRRPPLHQRQVPGGHAVQHVRDRRRRRR